MIRGREEPSMAKIEKYGAAGVYDPPGYSQGIKVTGAQTLLFTAGQVPYDAEGGVKHRGDFKAQARAVFAAIRALVTTGKVFALGIPLDRQGPQSGTRQRFNPIHTMFRDGGDAPRTPAQVADMQGYGGSDDWIVMPLQCVTQWDSLAHIFYEGKMYNGYDATLVTSSGAAKNSIDKTRDKIAGRGVLLDVARYKGVRALEPGYAITGAA